MAKETDPTGASRLPMLVLVVILIGVSAGVVLWRGRTNAGPARLGGSTSGTLPDLVIEHPEVVASRSGNRPWKPPTFTERQAERDRMVDTIRDYYGLFDGPTLAALRTVPRHEFVPFLQLSNAYIDAPLPIANGQLISQPWIVADMTMQLHLTPALRVLEIGTGSGYQAAVLTHFTQHVYSMEIIKPLAEAAGARLKRLGYDTIEVRNGDGFNGWPEAAPFDAIIVTCAAGQIPPPLLKQLAPGGRMMIPVGNSFAMQSLMLVEKDERGTIQSRSIAPVRFVAMVDKDLSADDKPKP